MGWGAVGGGAAGPQPAAAPALRPPQLVKRCNEGAHKMERTEQMYTLHTQLDFGRVKVGAASPPPRLRGSQPRPLPQPLRASVSHQSVPCGSQSPGGSPPAWGQVGLRVSGLCSRTQGCPGAAA